MQESEAKLEHQSPNSHEDPALSRLRGEFDVVRHQSGVEGILSRAAQLLPKELSTNLQLQQRKGENDPAEALKFAMDDALHKAMALDPQNNLIAWMGQGDEREQNLRRGTVSMVVMEKSREEQGTPQKPSANDLTGDALLIERQEQLTSPAFRLELTGGEAPYIKTDTPKRSFGRFLVDTVNKGVEKLKSVFENPRTRMVAKVGLFAIAVVSNAVALKYGATGLEHIHESLTAPDTITGNPDASYIPDATPIAPELPVPEPQVIQDSPVEHLLPEQITAFKVGDGGTGEQILQNLGVDPKQWYAISSDLAEKFPDEFYKVDLRNGIQDVRIAHAGQLSDEALQTIASRLGLWK